MEIGQKVIVNGTQDAIIFIKPLVLLKRKKPLYMVSTLWMIM